MSLTMVARECIFVSKDVGLMSQSENRFLVYHIITLQQLNINSVERAIELSYQIVSSKQLEHFIQTIKTLSLGMRIAERMHLIIGALSIIETPITEPTPEGSLWKNCICVHKTSLNWMNVFTSQTVRYIHTLMF